MTASDECSSSDSMESHTGDVHRINAHAFGDTRFQPLIEWIDTPGRGDTRGASYDEKLWNQTMSKLLERGQSGARIDRIVWVVNAAWQRATEVRNRMLQELRMSFGVDLYKNLVIMLNFLPHSANRTEYEEVKQRQKEKFVNWIMKREDEMFEWPAVLRVAVEEEVKNIQVFGADLNPKYLQEKPGDVPVSAPYLRNFPPFSHPSGVADLMEMIYQTWVKRQTGESVGLLLDNPHPRIGPGKVEKISSFKLNCGWTVPDEYVKKKAKELVIKPVAEIEVHGKSFSEWDKALVIPQNFDCGVRNPDDWSFEKTPWFQQVLPTSVGEENTSTTIQTSTWTEGNRQKLCFCEAPACNETWRFGQEQPLPAEHCPKPFHKVTEEVIEVEGAAKSDLPPYFFTSVQGRILGIPSASSESTLREVSFDNTSATTPRTSMHSLEAQYRKDWRTASAAGTSVYALDLSGHYILMIDVEQEAFAISMLSLAILPNPAPLNGGEDLPYFGILAVPGRLYLVPGKMAHIRIIDLEKPDLLQNISVGGRNATCRGRGSFAPDVDDEEESDGLCNQFATPCSAEGKLFAPPWEAHHYLVLDLNAGTEAAPALQSLEGAIGDAEYWSWSAFAESNGMIFGCPYYAREVLVVDAKEHKYFLTLTAPPLISQKPWTGVAVLKNHLIFAPGLESSDLLLVDSISGELWGIPTEKKEAKPKRSKNKKGMPKQGATHRPRQYQTGVPRGRNAWQRKSSKSEQRIEKLQRTAVSTNDKLLLSPGNLNYMLIMDISIGIDTTVIPEGGAVQSNLAEMMQEKKAEKS